MTKARKKPRKKKPKRSQRPTTPQLKKRLWRIFSQYIRLRDSDENGMCTCITCNYTAYWKGNAFNAGHFVPVVTRYGHNATYFHEMNVHPQCSTCNGREEGRGWQYGEYLKERYGPKTPQYLWDLAAKPFKFEREWLEERIEYYKKEVNELKLGKKIFN